MVKNDLREKDYYSIEKIPKQSMIVTVWVFMMIFMTALTIFGAVAIVGKKSYDDGGVNENALSIAIDEWGMTLLIGLLILSLILYLIFKLMMTLKFCSDKDNSIRFKLLEGNGMPVCSCREALKIWQTILIYLVPIVLIHGSLFTLCAFAEANAGVMLVIILLSFFMSFDLTLVVYVLYFRITERMEYISVDHHVYSLTFYNKTYIRINKAAKK